MRLTKKLLTLALTCFALTASISPSFADDSEIFTNTAFTSSLARPNILFIIDTSYSMSTIVANNYDETKDYSGTGYCPEKDRLYWGTANTSEPPDCRTSNQWVKVDNNRCYAAANGIASGGWWWGRLLQIQSPSAWGNLLAGRDAKLECEKDVKIHGDLPGTSKPGGEDKYPRNGTGSSDSDRWGPTSNGSTVSWNKKPFYALYSTNYINWYYGAFGGVDR